MTATIETDVAVVGGGPGGTTTALFLERHGVESVIIEQDPFPRFHIGESMTGEAGAIVRRLGLEEQMNACDWPVKFATEVYGTGGNNKFRVPVMARNGNGLATTSTWQVRRSDFDRLLFDTALARGVHHVRGKATEPMHADDGTITGIVVETDDDEVQVRARCVVDASGRHTWAFRQGLTGTKERGEYASQTAVFTHVKGAVRDPGDDAGNTIIFYSSHLHWGWFIPIDDEVVSIGIVAPNDYMRDFSGSIDEYFDHEMKTINPELARRTTDVELVEPVRATANFSYEVSDYVREGLVCVGDAHRFIDPIFSFGLYIAMAEAERAAATIARCVTTGDWSRLSEYHEFAELGQDTLQTLVDGFWSNPLAFGYMVHHSEYQEDFVDMFAGRIYERRRSSAYHKLGELISKAS